MRKEKEVKTIATTKIDKVENNNNLRLWRSIEHAIMKRHVLLNRRIRGWLAGRHVLPRWPSCTGARQAGLASSGCVPGGRGNGWLDSEYGRWVSRCSRPAITTMAITWGRSQSGHREINWDGGNPDIVTTTPR